MSIVDKITAETRTLSGVPWRPWESPLFGGRQAFAIGGPAHPARKYYDSEGALSLSAFYAATKFLSDAVASLSLKTYRRDPGTGKRERLWTSMLFGDEVSGGGPQADGTLYDWMFAGTQACLSTGTAVGLITNRSGFSSPIYPEGLPTGIAWLDSERVHIVDDEQRPENSRLARIYYSGRLIDRSEVVLLRAYTRPGHAAGLSPIRAFAMLISQGLDALNYSSTFYGAGGWPPSVLKNAAEEVDDASAKEIRRRLQDVIASRQALVLGRDWEWQGIDVPSDEATMVRTMQLNATQVASIFGIQPYRCGGVRADGLAYQNQSDAAIDEIVSGIMPWTKRWEHLLTTLMPANQYVRFDFDERLRVDPQTKANIRQIERNIGTRTADEIRAEDDLAPVTGGDDPFPLSALISMFRSTRAIPKSMIGLLDFEAERVAQVIENMQQQDPGLVGGEGKPPVSKTGEQVLGGLLAAGRSLTTAQLKEELRRRGELDD